MHTPPLSVGASTHVVPYVLYDNTYCMYGIILAHRKIHKADPSRGHFRRIPFGIGAPRHDVGLVREPTGSGGHVPSWWWYVFRLCFQIGERREERGERGGGMILYISSIISVQYESRLRTLFFFSVSYDGREKIMYGRTVGDFL